MADNDAGGVATYSLAGAKLGYPILFPLVIITVLLGVTQEMGMRLTVITRKGLADLIREKFGVKAAIFMFGALLIANIGTLITEIAAVKTTSAMLHIPPIPFVMAIVLVSFFFVTKGNYKLTQGIMLIASLFYIVYIISAVKAHPDWGLAFSNLFYPHGVEMTSVYLRDFLLIGMGVLGTTITPWGQFFISSFAFDKKIEKGKINYSQMETYWGAFLTDFFSFFMIVATAATLFVHGIPLVSGEQAALAIQPFAGETGRNSLCNRDPECRFYGPGDRFAFDGICLCGIFRSLRQPERLLPEKQDVLYLVRNPIDRGNGSCAIYSTFLVQGGRLYANHQCGGLTAGVLLLD